MSYPQDIESTKLLAATLLKKEYAQLYIKSADLPKGINKSYLNDYITKKDKLMLRSHQKFMRNWMSPNTPNKRLLGKWGTGIGKTLGSIAIALEYIKLYMDYYSGEFQEIQPSIFIIGFSRQIFQRELLKRPDFGFITEDELNHLSKLRWIAQSGTQSDRNAYSDFEIQMKKRLLKRNRGGFFKFFGYREFYNKLFIFADKKGDQPLGEAEITKGLGDGSVKLNLDLVKQFANSFVICDEIHNVYNSVEMNTYGLALKFIMNIYDEPENFRNLTGPIIDIIKRSILKAVFLSATPINNSPTEIVDLLNIIIPVPRLREFFQKSSIEKDDLFQDERNLKPGVLEKIRKVIKGYVSFLEERDPKHYPARVMMGQEIEIPRQLLSVRPPSFKGTKIPYLKFIKCEMSPLHYKTYAKFYDGAMSLDSQILNDIVIPNPTSDEFGLYKSKDIKMAIKSAPQKWKDEKQVDIVKQKVAGTVESWILTGEFLHLNNLRKCSTKYARLAEALISNLKNDGGKAIISHQLVKNGVLLIQEILKKNGIIDENSSPNPNTLCAKCAAEMQKHTGKSHSFMPARFIILYGEIDKLTIARSEEKWKSQDNIDGYQYRFLIGSSVINEAKDYSEIQQMHIMNMPGNIATLLQILGRAIRRDSSKRLPPEKRFVYTHLYVSSLPKKLSDLSNEEMRYYEKMMDYLVIQEIDRVFNEEAIDILLNKQTIKNMDVKKPTLELLPFKVEEPGKWKTIDSVKLKDLDDITFNIFNSDEEVETIIYIIKRLFLEQQSVWTYADLLNATKNPPFDVQTNASLFSEENFKIALYFLTKPEIDVYSNNNQDMINKLFDPNDRIFQLGQSKGCITKVGKFYMLVPMDEVPFVDFESWYRSSIIPQTMTINLTKDLKTIGVPYYQQKIKFYNEYSDKSVEKIPTSIERYNLQFHITLLQESVKYAFNILTNDRMPFSELHEFYLKMLYFYDKMDLILFADHLPDPLLKRYEKYITHDPITYGDDRILKEKHKFNALLMSSLIKSREPIKFDIHRLNEYLGKTKSKHAKEQSKYPGENVKIRLKMRDEVLQVPQKRHIVKAFANMLPVGHFLLPPEETGAGAVIPYLFDPDPQISRQEPVEWIKTPEFADYYKSEGEEEIENDIIVGYFERGDELRFKFKIREPEHQSTKYKDLRRNKRGAVCFTTKKSTLINIAKRLGLLSNTSNIENLCDSIKLELMKRELNARRKHKKGQKRIRWFYFHFE